jgi:glycosyltransferase involved in cell wall biosynthesis
MRIQYLLPDVSLFGGIKVVFQQAEVLYERGHRVAVISPTPPPDWYALRAPYVRLADWDKLPPADLRVATFWTTINILKERPGKAVHLCQGFEGIYSHNRDEHEAIEQAYSAPMPCWAVAPHLAHLVQERFGRPTRVIPQMLSPEFQPPEKSGPGQPFRIGIVALFECDWKGVETGVQAVKLLRERGLDCHLTRVSQWPLSKAEKKLLEPDEYHERLHPSEMPALIRGLDLLMAPSWEAEGFGLPALEAMASGVPVLASDVSCYRYFAKDAGPLVPPRDPVLWADAAQQILTDPVEWKRRSDLGLQVAGQFRDPGLELEKAIDWALDHKAN